MPKFRIKNDAQLRSFDRAIFEFLASIEARSDIPDVQIDGYREGADSIRAIRCKDKETAREIAAFVAGAIGSRTLMGLR